MFRTQGKDFGFPYPLSGSAVGKAREYSKWLWKENNWPKAKYPLSWLIDKFAPVPTWETKSEAEVKKGIVYYTDNRPDQKILEAVREQIRRGTNGNQIVSVSLQPVPDFGQNIVLPLERGYLTMFKQILAGIEACDADIIYFCEHDVLYHPSHFEFVPPRDDVFYYNENCWKVDAVGNDGKALFYYCKQTSQLVAYKKLLLEHYRKRVERVEKEGFTRRMGFEPGTHSPPRGICNNKAESFWSREPNIDIRHTKNLTANRWRQDQFRSQRSCRGWKMAEEIPGWGRTKGRIREMIEEFAKT
jgi:hypothetical protein